MFLKVVSEKSGTLLIETKKISFPVEGESFYYERGGKLVEFKVDHARYGNKIAAYVMNDNGDTIEIHKF